MDAPNLQFTPCYKLMTPSDSGLIKSMQKTDLHSEVKRRSSLINKGASLSCIEQRKKWV
jgi:hypothetical protein